MHIIIKCLNEVISVDLPQHFSSNIEIVQMPDKEAVNNYLKTEPACHYVGEYAINRPGRKDFPLKESNNIDGIFVLRNDYYRKILFSQILWVEASRSYSYFNVLEAQPIIVTFPLCEVERKLPAQSFIRIHRSYIINVRYIDAFVGNMLYIGGKNFPVSKQYQENLRRLFLILGNAKKGWERGFGCWDNE